MVRCSSCVRSGEVTSSPSRSSSARSSGAEPSTARLWIAPSVVRTRQAPPKTSAMPLAARSRMARSSSVASASSREMRAVPVSRAATASASARAARSAATASKRSSIGPMCRPMSNRIARSEAVTSRFRDQRSPRTPTGAPSARRGTATCMPADHPSRATTSSPRWSALAISVSAATRPARMRGAAPPAANTSKAAREPSERASTASSTSRPHNPCSAMEAESASPSPAAANRPSVRISPTLCSTATRPSRSPSTITRDPVVSRASFPACVTCPPAGPRNNAIAARPASPLSGIRAKKL